VAVFACHFLIPVNAGTRTRAPRAWLPVKRPPRPDGWDGLALGGPLDFPEPTRLDHLQPLASGEYKCTIIVRIIGGGAPYTIHHDLDVFTTWENDPAIVFKARGCGKIVHTMAVESADGQTVSHDYSIPAPWCE
jgi:hypothetical protein